MQTVALSLLESSTSQYSARHLDSCPFASRLLVAALLNGSFVCLDLLCFPYEFGIDCNELKKKKVES